MRKEAAKRGHREFFRLLYYLMDPVQLKSIPPRTDTIWVHGWLFKGVSRKSRRTIRAIIDAPGARPLLLAPISPPASSPRHLASIHGILIPIVVAVAEGKPSYSRTCTPSSSSFGFGAWGKLSCLPGPLRPPCHLAPCSGIKYVYLCVRDLDRIPPHLDKIAPCCISPKLPPPPCKFSSPLSPP